MLKQIKSANRIIFLKKFSEELVINSIIEKRFQKQKQIEKLKQKFLKPIDSEKQFQKSISAGFFKKPIYPMDREPIFHRLPIKPRVLKTKPILQKPSQIPMQKPVKIPAKTLVQPEARERPEGFSLGKLEPLIKNTSIQSIECPGPNKNILIKRYNKINITRTILNQAEITNIINNFAEKARIPVVGGILKAAVGDLIVSAVISEFVGSRFIINKITPYSLINK